MTRPVTALVLAAGLGTRMRPITDRIPKPLVPLAGRPLIDHVLDRLARAGIEQAVVNVHYLADAIERHLATRQRPRITISDERRALLDTGGAIVHALPLLGAGPFLVHNSDTVWIERGIDNLSALIETWDSTRMDSLMLLADRRTSLGYEGAGDFVMATDGRLARRARQESADLVFAGVSIAHPRLLVDAPRGAFSLNWAWDRAIAGGRLFGMRLAGEWMHVGTPLALAAAEQRMTAGDDH